MQMGLNRENVTAISRPRSLALADKACLGAVRLYQICVSPHKGFKCAHAYLTGGPSCSDYAREMITRFGCVHAVTKMRRRFEECRIAAAEVAKLPPDVLAITDCSKEIDACVRALSKK